jgi:hypothetical protein
LRPCGCLRQSRAPVALHELTETLTHQENVMQTLKNHFNTQARQTYLDLLVLWWLIFLLIGQYRRMERELAAKPRPSFRL